MTSSVLNRSINSTLTRFIIKLAYNNYQFLSFILSCFQDYYRAHLKSYQREAVSKKFTAKVLPIKSRPLLNESKVYSLGNIFKNNAYFFTKHKLFSPKFATLGITPNRNRILQRYSWLDSYYIPPPTCYYFKNLQTYSFAPIFAYSLTMDYRIVHGLTLPPPPACPLSVLIAIHVALEAF